MQYINTVLVKKVQCTYLNCKEINMVNLAKTQLVVVIHYRVIIVFYNQYTFSLFGRGIYMLSIYISSDLAKFQRGFAVFN